MKYNAKDPVTEREYENDLAVLPYLSITRDAFALAIALLTPEQIGNVIKAVVLDVYDGYDNGTPRVKLETKAEEVVYQTMCNNIGRLSTGYFKKIKNLKNNNKNKEEE